jgi:hypothetical protein
MQVKLWNQMPHFSRPLGEQWQHTAFKRLVHLSHPWASERDRSRTHRQLPRLPMPIAVACRRIHCLPPFRLPPAQKLRNFFLQDPLDELLGLLSNQTLQNLKHRRGGLRTCSCHILPHEASFLSPGLPPGLRWLILSGKVRRLSFYTPFDPTSSGIGTSRICTDCVSGTSSVVTPGRGRITPTL